MRRPLTGEHDRSTREHFKEASFEGLEAVLGSDEDMTGEMDVRGVERL